MASFREKSSNMFYKQHTYFATVYARTEVQETLMPLLFPFPRAIYACVNSDSSVLFSKAAFLTSVFSGFKQFHWISFFAFGVFVSLPRNADVVRTVSLAAKGSEGGKNNVCKAS